MKKYIALDTAVFAVDKKDYTLRKGDTVDLDENHITTRALLERKCIKEVEVAEKVEKEKVGAKNVLPKTTQQKTTNSKSTNNQINESTTKTIKSCIITE